MTLDEVRARLRKEYAPYAGVRGVGIRAWCRQHGLANSHVSEFLSGKRWPSSELLEVLGLEWEIVEKKRR
jgi:hypothetical protein